VNEMEKLAVTREYTCLMHNDIRLAQEGVCPRCGMPLVAVDPSVRGEYQFKVSSQPVSPRAGENVVLRFAIQHPQTGEPVKRYVVNHEKLFHLFIVSEDLSEYQHIHPQLEPDGTFSVATTLPKPGFYKLHADFFPAGGMPQVIHRDLSTEGYSPSKRATSALQPDQSFSKIVDGMNITLDLDSATFAAGNFLTLKYRLADARTGEPVRDLDPYLGAWGHTLILNADQSEYLHSHPTEMVPASGNGAVVRGGPNVEFNTIFPKAGVYRIWTQFQRAGKVSTVSFTVGVR
ncbi:MAG TPA: hypothetical protein VGW36_06500, partial [Pyrinomonadaceae bacterium]|nr:hypothetical protein [Pyrinomonadaceae bacterium]